MLTGLPGPTFCVPPPRHTGGYLLFLDFDGVLHPESVYLLHKHGPTLLDAPGHSLFEHCQLLEDVLAPYCDVRIVLSTSWVRRYRGSVRRVSHRLTPGLQARVIGATYHSKMDREEFAAAPRGMQIWSDVLRRKPEAWLALDDDWLHWPAWCREQLVRTDEVLGISAPSVLAELKTKLATMFDGT
ncbi:HAD domain-containing protein [Paraburkholderia sp. A3BS-1L]|uniref:HAD domain-containing protein n=1 Tax=Paraburkholderia sp. A3BS-1L TaxID=3028375 RepID=UPI003DA9751F